MRLLQHVRLNLKLHSTGTPLTICAKQCGDDDLPVQGRTCCQMMSMASLTDGFHIKRYKVALPRATTQMLDGVLDFDIDSLAQHDLEIYGTYKAPSGHLCVCKDIRVF